MPIESCEFPSIFSSNCYTNLEKVGMRSCYSLIEVMCSLSVVIRVCCIQTYFVYDLEICLLNLGIAMDSSVKPMNLVDLSSSYFPYSREKKNKIKTKNILFQSYTEVSPWLWFLSICVVYQITWNKLSQARGKAELIKPLHSQSVRSNIILRNLET